MTEATRQRLFDPSGAFSHPVTLWITVALGIALAITPPLILAASRLRHLDAGTRRELWLRYSTWLVLTPMMVGPILLGAAWTILAVTCLSIWCYVEFARSTPLRGQYPINAAAVTGMLVMNFGALDHWWELFGATTPVTICVIAAVSVCKDEPHGYLQRVALGALGFCWFGTGLAHLSYLANDPGYRPLLLLVLLAVELNDIFAFLCGKLFGRRKLAPHTSPGKTVGGSMGALCLTSLLVVCIGRVLFAGTQLEHPALLVLLGVMFSGLGQLGDLVISSVKRDLGVKDMGSALPGHGGILDRFDSLILVAPCAFYFIGHFHGLGLDEPLRIFTKW